MRTRNLWSSPPDHTPRNSAEDTPGTSQCLQCIFCALDIRYEMVKQYCISPVLMRLEIKEGGQTICK